MKRCLMLIFTVGTFCTSIAQTSYVLRGIIIETKQLIATYLLKFF